MRAYYFGCIGDAGHYYWCPGPYRWSARHHEGPLFQSTSPQLGADVRLSLPTPWGYSVDGKLQPQDTGKNGRALVHHREGWTALAFWDSTVDRRGGSCSTFCFDAQLDFCAALAAAREHFPEVVGRFPWPIVPHEPPAPVASGADHEEAK